jgi:hypothetical protein
MATTHRGSDFGAAITGLVVGGCVLFALIFGIVELTHHHYVSEQPAAETSK